jgi:hypothetical protein
MVDPIYKTSEEIKEERLDRQVLEELINIQPTQPVRKLKVI